MNAVVEMKPGALVAAAGRMAAPEVLAHVAVVQDVLANVMKKDVHYGTIPGTDKPTLLQPGADVLAMAFRIAFEIHEEDLSTEGVVRYRVKVRAVHQPTGTVLGEGVGECSGAEEKYRWRRAVCDEEFDATPASMKRVKYGRKGGGFYTVKQVMTESADAANTVLKMAVKRAKTAVILNVTGASAVFGQDIEDLPEELREAFSGRGAPPSTVEMTPEQRAAWKAESEKGRKAGRAFWASLPENVRNGVAQEEKDAMWAIAEAADKARTVDAGTPGAPPSAPVGNADATAAAPPSAPAANTPPPADDDFVAAMNAAEKAGAGAA